MSEKVEVKDQVDKPVEGQDFRKFDYADVFFECNRCGHMTVLDKGIEDGLSFVLPATDTHEWRMVCNNCKNMMRIFFRASSNEVIEEKKALKKKQEEEANKTDVKTEKDEPKKENKEKESTKGSTKSPERVDETDAKGGGSATADNADRS